VLLALGFLKEAVAGGSSIFYYGVAVQVWDGASDRDNKSRFSANGVLLPTKRGAWALRSGAQHHRLLSPQVWE